MSAKIKEKLDASVEGKLKNLYELQLIDSKIDNVILFILNHVLFLKTMGSQILLSILFICK